MNGGNNHQGEGWMVVRRREPGSGALSWDVVSSSRKPIEGSEQKVVSIYFSVFPDHYRARDFFPIYLAAYER